jgi:hypothetical protein
MEMRAVAIGAVTQRCMPLALGAPALRRLPDQPAQRTRHCLFHITEVEPPSP